MITSDHLERYFEAVQKIAGQLEAIRGACKELLAVRLNRLALAKVTQGHDARALLRQSVLSREDGKKVLSTRNVVVHVTGIKVQVSEDGNRKSLSIVHAHACVRRLLACRVTHTQRRGAKTLTRRGGKSPNTTRKNQ